jgi:hypothetical protein
VERDRNERVRVSAIENSEKSSNGPFSLESLPYPNLERWSGEGYGSAVIEGIRPLKAKEKGKQ